MSALTAGRKVDTKRIDPNQMGLEISFTVAASTKIYEGSFNRIDPGGDLVPCDGNDDALFPCVGLALETVDNSNGSDADLSVLLLVGACIVHVVGSAVKDDIGKRAYASDDQTLILTPTNEFVGWIVGMSGEATDSFVVKMAWAGMTDAAGV